MLPFGRFPGFTSLSFCQLATCLYNPQELLLENLLSNNEAFLKPGVWWMSHNLFSYTTPSLLCLWKLLRENIWRFEDIPVLCPFYFISHFHWKLYQIPICQTVTFSEIVSPSLLFHFIFWICKMADIIYPVYTQSDLENKRTPPVSVISLPREDMLPLHRSVGIQWWRNKMEQWLFVTCNSYCVHVTSEGKGFKCT